MRSNEESFFVACANWVGECEIASAVFEVPFSTWWFEWVQRWFGVCDGRCVVFGVCDGRCVVCVVGAAATVVWAVFVCVGMGVGVVVGGSAVVPSAV